MSGPRLGAQLSNDRWSGGMYHNEDDLKNAKILKIIIASHLFITSLIHVLSKLARQESGSDNIFKGW
jgi:hypothetical protein